MCIRYKITLVLLLLAAWFTTATAQNESLIISLKGRVLDEFGNPIYNALLVSENEANQYITGGPGFPEDAQEPAHRQRLLRQEP